MKLEPKEGDYIARNFKFRSGETLPELRLHYTTLGTPHRNARGEIDNAVLIMHGTGGDGKQFFRPQFADVLFAPGGLLDPAKYYIILRDGVGHGKSSKPSDGLRAKFPHYDYDDMVAADHELLTKGLGVNHARLIMGTSMGCMHSFVWGETYPDFMDALMPLACLPTEIAGRNRVWRKLLIDAIRNDPDWKGGDYTTPAAERVAHAEGLLLLAGGAPIVMQNDYPTRDKADAYAQSYVDDQHEDASTPTICSIRSRRRATTTPRRASRRSRRRWCGSTRPTISSTRRNSASPNSSRSVSGRESSS